jgi:hypothetical protein
VTIGDGNRLALAFETTRERVELERPEGVLHGPDCPTQFKFKVKRAKWVRTAPRILSNPNPQ